MRLVKKIVLVAFEIGVVSGYEAVRSAHIQVPYMLAKDLEERGYDVVIATNALREGTFIPRELSGIPVVFIPDPRKRKAQNVMHAGFSTKIDIFGILRAIFAIRKIIGNDRDSVLHFVNGSFGVGLFASITSMVVRASKVVWTPSFPFILKSKWFLPLFRQIDELVCSSSYLTTHLAELGLESKTVKHGTTRTFSLAANKKFRVLFWRDPSFENGADIALKVFRVLAPEFPNITFTMMIRPHWDSLVSESKEGNIEIYEYPYKGDVSLEGILSETLACYFPFRELSTNPQLCILESLNAGIPCFVSRIESVAEYVLDSDFLIENNTVDQGVLRLREFLCGNRSGQSVTPPQNNGFCWDNFTASYIKIYISGAYDEKPA